jgi:hypothetical protein
MVDVFSEVRTEAEATVDVFSEVEEMVDVFSEVRTEAEETVERQT